MKKNLFFVLIYLLTFYFSDFVFAQFNVSVSPRVIYEKTQPRNVLDYKIKIKNLNNTLYHFYTFVLDINDFQNLESKKDTSLASWVEIFRGRIEIFPQEEKEIPLTIRVPYYAKPGNYFAEIIFAQGSTEIDAREKIKTINMPKVLLNINVEPHIVEKLQIRKFNSEKNFYFDSNIKFKIEIENIGNTEVKPRAKILIYGKRGEEIDVLNLEEKTILAGETKNYEANWHGKNIGQFKAVLFGEYGENNEKTFHDTSFFWVINWQLLLLLFLFLLVLIVLIVWFFSRIFKKRYSEVFKPKKVFDVFPKI